MGNLAESTTDLLGVRLYRLGMSAALSACESRTASAQGGYACFVNVHSLTETLHDPEIRRAITGSTHAFPDGVPLRWASRLTPDPISERVSGPDFMKQLLTKHPGKAFGFIGGRPGQAEVIAKKFGVRAISYAPPFRPFTAENAREDWNAFVDAANQSGEKLPEFVWVCLGAPKQELWMEAVTPLTKSSFFFGVGAAIDFLAGDKRRAPTWMQKSGLEWAYRLGQEPGRLWKRYLKTNFEFIASILKEYLFRFSRRR